MEQLKKVFIKFWRSKATFTIRCFSEKVFSLKFFLSSNLTFQFLPLMKRSISFKNQQTMETFQVILKWRIQKKKLKKQQFNKDRYSELVIKSKSLKENLKVSQELLSLWKDLKSNSNLTEKKLLLTLKLKKQILKNIFHLVSTLESWMENMQAKEEW